MGRNGNTLRLRGNSFCRYDRYDWKMKFDELETKSTCLVNAVRDLECESVHADMGVYVNDVNVRLDLFEECCGLSWYVGI